MSEMSRKAKRLHGFAHYTNIDAWESLLDASGERADPIFAGVEPGAMLKKYGPYALGQHAKDSNYSIPLDEFKSMYSETTLKDKEHMFKVMGDDPFSKLYMGAYKTFMPRDFESDSLNWAPTE